MTTIAVIDSSDTHLRCGIGGGAGIVQRSALHSRMVHIGHQRERDQGNHETKNHEEMKICLKVPA
jgi:hypothetical protein